MNSRTGIVDGVAGSRRLRLTAAVALLVLLARPTPAGVVAADFVVLVFDHGLDHLGRRRCRRRPPARRPRRPPLGAVPPPAATCSSAEGWAVERAAGVVERRRLGAAVAGERRRACAGLDFDLGVEDEFAELLPDRVHQLLEHREALVFVGDQGVDLGEAAEVDALAQVVHVEEVFAPAVVDHLQQDRALEVAHQLLAELLLALVVGVHRVVVEVVLELLAVDRLRRQRGDLDADRPDLAQLRLQLAQVPVLEQVAGGVLVDQALDHALELVAGGLGDVAAFEDLAAVFVDDAALLVHHVVVLEHAFADQEVLLLDLLLGVLDGFRQHLRLERHFGRRRRRPGRGGRGFCRCGRRRRGGSRRLRRRGRSATRRGRPGGRSGRAAGCRCGATRGARCRR